MQYLRYLTRWATALGNSNRITPIKNLFHGRSAQLASKGAKDARKNLEEAVRNLIYKLHFGEDASIAQQVLAGFAARADRAGVDVEKTVRSQRHTANAAFNEFNGEAQRVIDSIVSLTAQVAMPASAAPAAAQRPTITPAGWYPDPRGAPGHRWWDGQQWTEHYQH